MNALNIISSRVSPPPSPGPSRTNSLGTLNITVTDDGDVQSPDDRDERNADDNTNEVTEDTSMLNSASDSDSYLHIAPSPSPLPSENTPLLSLDNKDSMGIRSSPSHLYPRGIATTLINSIRWVLSTLAAPGVYLIACLYTDEGDFSPLYQLRRLFTSERRSPTKLTASELEKEMLQKSGIDVSPNEKRVRGVGGSGSSSSGVSSESESDIGRHGRTHSYAAGRRHSRSTSLGADTEESTPARRSIRIKLHEESGKRSHRKSQSSASVARASRAQSKNNSAPVGADGASDTKDISAQLKSPTSPVGALTRYPKTPAPPRPLIPRRQPSYINIEAPDKMHQKTLILDLDETLIHSMSKGGRMSTGHMVEVRLQQTVTAGSATLGPQHPILYYVHKRPHCDDFLRRVCKWYNLVVFTASVQEYADPVIDWLESERKFFSGRFYRQHCTFRHGAFIKDLSFVEPDLSKVMILDNSPLSYMFHQDNAIPIQGWINDPTDNDLLHLVPFLEGLQYVSDVRALLALRGGEDGQHMAYN